MDLFLLCAVPALAVAAILTSTAHERRRARHAAATGVLCVALATTLTIAIYSLWSLR